VLRSSGHDPSSCCLALNKESTFVNFCTASLWRAALPFQSTRRATKEAKNATIDATPRIKRIFFRDNPICANTSPRANVVAQKVTEQARNKMSMIRASLVYLSLSMVCIESVCLKTRNWRLNSFSDMACTLNLPRSLSIDQ